MMHSTAQHAAGATRGEPRCVYVTWVAAIKCAAFSPKTQKQQQRQHSGGNNSQLLSFPLIVFKQMPLAGVCACVCAENKQKQLHFVCYFFVIIFLRVCGNHVQECNENIN